MLYARQYFGGAYVRSVMERVRARRSSSV
jgi:hypothetical protein